MRPVVITQTGAGQSTAVPLDLYLTPFNVSLSTIVNGTVAYGIEYTFDDPFNPPTGGLDWTVVGDIPTGTIAAGYATISNSPVRAVRINQASGSGSVTLTVNQAGAR